MKAILLLAAVLGFGRTLVAQTTVAEWQAKAVKALPELGVAGSPFHKLFVATYEERRQTTPEFFQNPSWPWLLANDLVRRPEFSQEASKTGRLVEWENKVIGGILDREMKKAGVSTSDGRPVRLTFYALDTVSEGRIALEKQSDQLRKQFQDVNYRAPVIVTGSYNRILKSMGNITKIENVAVAPASAVPAKPTSK